MNAYTWTSDGPCFLTLTARLGVSSIYWTNGIDVPAAMRYNMRARFTSACRCGWQSPIPSRDLGIVVAQLEAHAGAPFPLTLT